MAQIKIRKYNPGGVLTTETGDIFTLEEIEQLVRENPTNENLKDIANELRAGKNVQHSISDNWSSVTDDDFKAGQKRRVAKNPNSFGRRLAATFNTQIHQYGEDVNDTTALLSAAHKNASTNNEGSAAGSTSVPADEYTLISSGGGSRFVYDDNGVYVKGDFTNAKLMSLLRDLHNYFSDDNGGASYKFKGISADVRKTLKEMYEANPNLFNDLMNKVQSGQIIEGSPEASLLLSIGIGSNMTKDQVEQSAKDKALKDYFVGKGFTEDQYKDFLPFVELDGQGLRLKNGVEGGPFIAGQNYYFNDDYNGPFKDLVKGQILFNNRFYNANELAQSGMIADWVKALREHRFANANAMIRWDWKNVMNNYDYQLFNNQKYYNDFLDGKRYLDITGQYEKQYDDYGNPYQYIGYYDPNDSDIYTPLGFVDPSKIKYARLDSMGNVTDENYNMSYIRKAMTPWQHESVFQERRSDGQVIIPTFTTRDGYGILGMDVSHDPDRGTVQFHGAAVQNVLGDGNGDTIELDGEIAKILSREFFMNIEKVDKKNRDKFKDTILSLVGNKFGNLYVRNQLSRDEWVDVLRPTYGEDAEQYANILFNYFKEYIGKTSIPAKIGSTVAGWGAFRKQIGREARINKFTPKHQHGGLFTGSAVAASSAPRIVQSDKYMPATTEEAGAFQFNEFTDADWFELAGLGADLASVVTGVTGFTPASVATGLAGTGSSFMADIRRDGFQMKDLGNLGLGLLFDAASIVPGLGVAASTGQVMRTIKKGLPVLMKLAGMAGIGSSLSLAVNKIKSGEELTMRDLRIIMNGVLGAYTIGKQGVGFKNDKANGKTIDVDIKKAHMDQIDASNLSDGQKAAMKHHFDDTYNPTGLSADQQKIYDQFLKDGGDELALKMLIGDNDTFKAIKRDWELLDRAEQSLRGGQALSKEDVIAYDDLLKRSNIARHKVEQPEFDNLVARARANNADLRNALETLETNPGDVIAQGVVAGYRADPKYNDFFDSWDALPKEARIDTLNNIIATGTDDFHKGMFRRKNRYYRAGDTDEQAAIWAADVKQREKVADELLAGFDQSRVKSAQADVEAARTKKANLETQKKTEINEWDQKIKDAETDLATAEANAKLIDPSGTSKSRAAVDARKKVADAIVARDKLVINKAEVEAEFNTQIADADDAIKVARSARLKINKDFKTWETAVKGNSDIEVDPTTGLYRKSTKLTQEVGDVDTQFDPTGVLTKSQAEAERRGLLKSGTEDALRANFAQERAGKVKTLLDNTLSGDGQIAGKFDDDSLWNGEFARLSPEDKVEVSKILSKKLSDLSDDEIALLNHYTAKSHGVKDTEITGMWSASRQAGIDSDAFKNFKLADDAGIDTVNALLKKSNFHNSKVKLSETEWAQLKKADDQVAAFKAILKKKGVNDESIKKIATEVFVEVEKPADSGRTWFGKRKKSNTSSTVSTSQQPDFKIDESKFIDLPGKADDTLKGRILGHSTEQRDYKKDLYGMDRNKTDLRNMPHRYYQPMIHGLHYNLMRDPVHHTPWYEPKEITIQLENEEE